MVRANVESGDPVSASSIPIPRDEAARLEALRTYNVLDTPPEPEFDELVKLAAQVCGCPVALITLVDQTRQWYKARVGLDAEFAPRSGEGLCSHAIMSREVMVVPDLAQDPRFVASPTLKKRGLRFYAAAPLVNREDLVLGTICVLDHEPRTLTDGQLDALRTLSRQVVAQLELRRLAAVGEFRERLVAILSNDLRGPLQQILLAARHGLKPVIPLGAPEQRYLSQIAITAERMTRMMRDVLDFTQTRLGNGLSINARPTNLQKICRRVVQEFALSYTGREIELEFLGDSSGVWDEDRLAQAISNLLANALRYGAPGKPVRISCTSDEQVATLTVWNEGRAIPPDVLPRLFAPFCRGSDDQAADAAWSGVGLGLYIVKEIATASGGTVEAVSTNDQGTKFRMRLPRRLPLLQAESVRTLLRH